MPDPLDFIARLESFGSPVYPGLRDPQARALAAYAAHAATPDIAIELPTGYGKTLIALLVADLALEQGRSAAYLTGNNQLSDQVVAQAAGLPGLEIARFAGGHYPAADLAAYHDARAVGVMNYWTYFNTSPRVEPADLVIFDDAHLAEQPLAGLFAVRIDRRGQPELYEDFCDLVLSHTEVYPSVRMMREDAAGPTTPPELLAFTHWAAIASTTAQRLGAALPTDVARFVWPRLRPHLEACGVLIGPSAIEIRPYHPPTETLAGYRHAKQRLYLSATLGTMDDLQRRLGVQPIVNVLDTPVSSSRQAGERLFVLNPSQAGPLDQTVTTFALNQASHIGRAAWLCASHSEADAVERLLADRGLRSYRLRGGGDDSVLDRWTSDPAGHLVTAGRYDGLDFAGDTCRLVVLPSVPAASTEFERFVMAYLGDATYMRHRVGQRVTQALGRANRREGDWAMYLGLAPTFGTLLAQSGVRAAIPADVRPVIDQALDRLAGGWLQVERDTTAFWQTTGASGAAPNDSNPSRRERPGRARAAATAGSAPDEVEAVTQLWLGDSQRAAAAATRAADKLAGAGEMEHAAFWRYVQAQAEYTSDQPGATGRAIEALRATTEGGSRTAWFVRLGKVLADLRGAQAQISDELPWVIWDEWLRESGPASVMRRLERIHAELTGTHDQQVQALLVLGRLAGATTHRPAGQSVTDAVWSWPGRRQVERRLWEVKTGNPDQVPRDWVDQCIGQVAAEQQATTGVRVIGCILTHLNEAEEEAAQAAHDIIAFVHVQAAVALFDLLFDRMRTYAEHWGEGRAAERGAAREAVEGRMPQNGWLTKLLQPTQGHVLDRATVKANWASD